MSKAKQLAKKLLEADQPFDAKQFIMVTKVREKDLYHDLVLDGYRLTEPWYSDEDDEPDAMRIALKDVKSNATHRSVIISVEPHRNSEGKIVVDIVLRDIEGKTYGPSWTVNLPYNLIPFLRELEQSIQATENWHDLAHKHKAVKP